MRDRRTALVALGTCLAALLGGTALRLWNLGQQIVAGDELHGIRVALGEPLGAILTTYRPADPCIPLTAVFRLFVEAGLPLTDGLVRSHSVATGLLALVLFPWLALRALGSPRAAGSLGSSGGTERPAPWGDPRLVAAVLAGWMAISPSFVFYSRISRPYMLLVVVATLAVAAFWVGWRDLRQGEAGKSGGVDALVVYGLAAGLSAWIHLGAAPFVALPLAFAGSELLLVALKRRRRGEPLKSLGRPLLKLLATGLAFAGAMALFLVPAWPSLMRLIGLKAKGEWPDAWGWAMVALMQAGSRHPWAAGLFWTLALLGLAVLLRRLPRLGLYTLTLTAGQVVGMLVLSPLSMEKPLVLNRYLLVATPLVLLWVAVGSTTAFGTLARSLRGLRGGEEPGDGEAPGRRGGFVAGAGSVLVLLLLLIAGPYADDPALRLGPFAGSNAALLFYEPPVTMPAEAVPGVYRMIAAEPMGSAGEDGLRDAVLEVAWPPTWSYHLVPMTLQKVHGRPVAIAHTDVRLRGPEVDLEGLVFIRPDHLEAAGIRWVVLHRNPPADHRVLAQSVRPPPQPWPPKPGRNLTRTLEALEGRLTERWGEPHFVEPPGAGAQPGGGVVVWDLARVVKQRSGPWNPVGSL